MSTNLVNIIFGMKIRQARLEAEMTLSEFARQCELSPSYATEIEKGRKYPRADKIMKMAQVLGKQYDDLVSIALDPSLSYLESALSSAVLQRFPFEEFGLEPGDLVSLLTREPDKASALIHAIIALSRQFDLSGEDFFRATLRSYQEIYENYFQELEDAALAFSEMHSLGDTLPVTYETLAKILREQFHYLIDQEMIAKNPPLAIYRSVYLPGKRPCLAINNALTPRQMKFLLARELGYQYLGLEERSYASTPDRIQTFQQILNDYKAAYFGGVLLMPRQPMLADIERFFKMTSWDPQPLLDMLKKYHVTPEMLLYRFSELIPQFFGIKLHFLRFHHLDGRYKLIRHLNMNQLPLPSGLALDEHYCRRWLSVRLFGDELPMNTAPEALDAPLFGVQMSEFIDSGKRFFCIGFARPMSLMDNVVGSVTIGFSVDSELRNTIRFIDDPSIHTTMLHESCERCPLTAAQCSERAVPATILQKKEQQRLRKLTIDQLRKGATS